MAAPAADCKNNLVRSEIRIAIVTRLLLSVNRTSSKIHTTNRLPSSTLNDGRLQSNDPEPSKVVFYEESDNIQKS